MYNHLGFPGGRVSSGLGASCGIMVLDPSRLPLRYQLLIFPPEALLARIRIRLMSSLQIQGAAGNRGGAGGHPGSQN